MAGLVPRSRGRNMYEGQEEAGGCQGRALCISMMTLDFTERGPKEPSGSSEDTGEGRGPCQVQVSHDEHLNLGGGNQGEPRSLPRAGPPPGHSGTLPQDSPAWEVGPRGPCSCQPGSGEAFGPEHLALVQLGRGLQGQTAQARGLREQGPDRGKPSKMLAGRLPSLGCQGWAVLPVPTLAEPSKQAFPPTGFSLSAWETG